MHNFKYDIAIIGGFGHVGLPLGIVFADAGLQVTLIDIDTSKRSLIESGKMPFIEYDAESILQNVIGQSLHIADTLADAQEAQCIIITIGTPVDEYLNPKTRPIFELAESLSDYVSTEQFLVLRSTVYPGTSKFLHNFFEHRNQPVDIAYCPERIIQGYAIRELRHLPQIISGFSASAIRRSHELFCRLGVETIEVSVEEAELAKLFSNAWRYIQFSITNQFYMIANEHGASYERVYHAMTHHYERAQDFPKPGFAAGPCLLKDTLQLAAFYGNNFQLGHAAMMVNEGLPQYLVDHLKQSLDSNELLNCRVGVLGMAFKAEIDDIRDSLSYKLVKILKFHGALVFCSDEYVDDPTFLTKETLIEKCEVLVVGVPHKAYRELVVPSDTVLVDLWGIVTQRSTHL